MLFRLLSPQRRSGLIDNACDCSAKQQQHQHQHQPRLGSSPPADYYGSYSSSSEYDRPYPKPMLEFPPPPPYYDPYDLSSDSGTVLEECVECSLSAGAPSPPDNVPIYATGNSLRRTSPKFQTTPRHFGLSKKGLLQIDYSCNWQCLDFNFNKMRF